MVLPRRNGMRNAAESLQKILFLLSVFLNAKGAAEGRAASEEDSA